MGSMLFIACTPAPNAEPVPRAVLAAPSVRAAPLAAPAEPASVTPNAPPGANAEHVELLSNVCAMARVRTADGKTQVGCASHPPFVKPEQRPREQLVDLSEDRMRMCEIVAVHRGSFSRPGAVEAVVVFGECYDADDSFETNAIQSESVVLLENVAGRWLERAYEANMHGELCWVGKNPGGVDALWCRSGLVAPGAGAIDYLFSLDFRAHETRARTFARMYSHRLACAAEPDDGPRLPHGFVTLQIGEVQASSAGFTLEVTRDRIPPSAALVAKAQVACKKQPSSFGESLARRGQKTLLKFVPRGTSFEPDAATATLLAQWESETPDAAGEMRAASP